ncbi:MAG TPA: trypsin-like peptidase domain-containing protein, partial [Kofleriaceae bacterium]|nr:trypsin-like peptidase domain-containing protein [Kofleriaceae bacterium]
MADTAEKVVDSVVTISTSQQMKLTTEQQFFLQNMGNDERDLTQQAQGSGVIVTATGRVLTNAHVIQGADTIKVTLAGGTEVEAKVVGKDVHADLAVLQLQGKLPALKPITFGDSSALRLGDIVLAVGNGLGVGKSVSMGIISAKGLVNLGIEEYEDFLQTDATINPGNSGGALVNLKGELVGINTAIASRSGGSQGIGFAIPTNMVRPIMEALIKDGKFTRGYLGVNIGTVTPEVLKEHKLGASEGVVVGGIQPGGPAARTGLEMGDVVTAVGGKNVKTDSELRTRIAETKPGTVVDLAVVHQDGRKAVVKVKLGELPEETSQLQRR